MKNTITLPLCSFIAIFFLLISSADAQNAKGEYPVGIATDKPGILISPFPPGRKLDVTGLKPGSLAMDPSVEKIFRIPQTTKTTKGNVGKKPSSYADYTGKKKPRTVPLPDSQPEPTAPNRVMPSTQPSLVSPGSSGTVLTRPRDPGLGNGAVTPQAPIGSTNSSATGLPEDLVKLVYSFNDTASNNTPDATLPFYDGQVLYFGKKNQDHKAIARDRANYIRKYPSRKYRITSEPTVLSSANGVYELVYQVSYTVQGKGRPISGKVADYLIVKKTPAGYRIVGIDETKAGASRPSSLRKEATRVQAASQSVVTAPPPPQPMQNQAGVQAQAPIDPNAAPPQQQEEKKLAFTGSIEDQLGQFVSAFVKSGELNDPAACLKFVDSNVSSYYDLKRPNQQQLLRDRSNYIKQWPTRTYTLSEDLNIKEIGDRIYEIGFKIKYRVRNKSRTVGGSERSYMQVAETEQGLKIISLFSK